MIFKNAPSTKYKTFPSLNSHPALRVCKENLTAALYTLWFSNTAAPLCKMKEKYNHRILSNRTKLGHKKRKARTINVLEDVCTVRRHIKSKNAYDNIKLITYKKIV
jgi:hypothetical protein